MAMGTLLANINGQHTATEICIFKLQSQHHVHI